MTLADAMRYAFVGVFGFGAAFMVATNIIAFRVLRPPKKLGFLWWHVTSISISFLCFGSVVISRTLERLNRTETVDADWHTFAAAAGVLLFTAAQVIIFGIERQRLAHIQALKRGLEGPILDVK